MKLKIFILTVCLTIVFTACKDQLDVKNEVEATFAILATEKGMLGFSQSGVYINGFKDLKFSDGVLGSFWGNGFFDLMADNIGAEAANVFMNQIGAAESVKLDNGTTVLNPNSPKHQPAMLRQNNLNSNAGANCVFYEWGYMYALNHVCNVILDAVDKATYTGDAATKKATIKAWAYWWKGFAYSRIGSIYYAGLIIDNPDVTNGNYKTSAEILNEAENNFAKCQAILPAAASADYNTVVGKLIPDIFQVGKGGILTPSMWIRNINTMRARNILANTRVSAMTPALWNQILTLTNAGVTSTDLVFTGRSNSTGDLLSPLNGALAAKSTGNPTTTATYKISERLVQAFQPGDKRKTNNFGSVATWLGNVDRGNIFSTRWQLLDGGAGQAGVIVYSNRTPGAYELYMAGTYEENELMKAEANIYLNNIVAGTGLIDAIRTYQGAGLAAIGLVSQANAIVQLRSERRVALLFRGAIAFYDARRYGVIDPLASGGGVTGAIVIDNSGGVNVNATIDYQFLDYWDIPDNERVYNPPAAGSAPTVNPKN